MSSTHNLSSALLAALLSGLPLACQEPDHSASEPANRHGAYGVSMVLMLRCGPSDITLNEVIVESLLTQPAVRKPFRNEFGDAFEKLEGVDVTLHGGHAKGTYQLSIDCTVRMGGDWSAQRTRVTRSTIATYLQERLGQMLYLRPLAELRKQREELQARMVEAQTQLVQLETRDHDLMRETERLREERMQLQQQILEAELESATEEHARAHLAKMREQNIQLREQLRASIQASEREHSKLKATLGQLHLRLAPLQAKFKDYKEPPPVLEPLKKQVADLESAQAQVVGKLSEWQEIASDVQNLLTVVLEQLPASELALQRARARLTSLQKRLERSQAESAHLRTQSKQASQRAVARQRLEIDMQVATQRLVEIESLMTRMKPVRYELLL